MTICSGWLTVLWTDFLLKCEYIGIQYIIMTRTFQSCPLMILLQLVADVGDLSPHLAWSRMSLLLAGDVETNPGPTTFQSIYCSGSSPEQFPFTDKNVSTLNIVNYLLLMQIAML